eukprot:m.245867 g.245867  ORF g.245867 m.245867 type:complete len:393 (+) comp19055_c2_seq1:162-1340(+)
MASFACRAWVFVLVVAVLGVGPSRAQKAQRHLLNLTTFPTARCLDGTPGGFFFMASTSAANNTKWVFSLEGGGECVTQESCLGRTHGSLGSSKFFQQEMSLGQLQGDCSYNPEFCTYNKVFIKYCSGDLHLGQQSTPSSSTWGLQFSGHNIVKAVLSTLKESHNLGSASNIVWSGDSAGGIGSFAHCDFVADTVPNAFVHCVPIGGFYFSNEKPYAGTDPAPNKYIPWTYAAMDTYVKLWSAFVPTRCAQARSSSPWECVFSNASYATLNTPVFFVEGQTDKVVMPLHDGLPAVWDAVPKKCDNTVEGCPEQVVDYMKTWSSMMIQGISQVKGSERDGYFNPACLIHTSFASTHPLIDGRSYSQAVADWMFARGKPNHLADTCGVLCNTHCT